MNLQIKRNIIIASISAIVLLVIWSIFLIKNNFHFIDQPYSDEKTQIISREFNESGDMNHIMQYDCELIQQKDAKDYCESKQETLSDFYSELTWDFIEPQLTQKQLEWFYCDMLSETEIKKCKDAIFLYMGQK